LLVTIRIIFRRKKMEMIRRLEPVALLVMVLGALNWGMVGLFDTNVISDVFGGGTLTDVVYVIVGVCGLLYIPQLLDSLHIGGHAPHPRGT
jgi:uncharacterized membrane protein YuzA (DUF378 family)